MSDSALYVDSATHQQNLAAHVIALRNAEKIDRARGLLRLPGTAERHHHRQRLRGLFGYADGKVPAVDRDLRVLSGERLREASIDEAEGDAIHVHLVAAPFLRQRLGETDESGLGR